MRTIAATFATRDEAETARRRLQAIGVSPGEVILKDLGETGGGNGSLPTPAGIFLSVKVSPDQVPAAAEILKGQREEYPAAASAADTGSPSKAGMAEGEQIGTEARLEDQPLPEGPRYPELKASSPGVNPQHRPGRSGETNADWRRWSRQIVVFCLVLVVAFIAGALLGFVT